MRLDQDVVQANLLAALTRRPGAPGSVVNVAAGKWTGPSRLFEEIRARVARAVPEARRRTPAHPPSGPEDAVHCEADTSRGRRLLEFTPGHDLERGLDETVGWLLEPMRGSASGV